MLTDNNKAWQISRQKVKELIDQVRPILSSDQIRTIEEDWSHGEFLIPVESIASFIVEDDIYISQSIYSMIEELMKSMNSAHSTEYLRRLIK